MPHTATDRVVNTERGAGRTLWIVVAVVLFAVVGSTVDQCLTCPAPAKTEVALGTIGGTALLDIGKKDPEPAPAAKPALAENTTAQTPTADEAATADDAPDGISAEELASLPQTAPATNDGATNDGVEDAAEANAPAAGEEVGGYLNVTFDKLANYTYEFPDMESGEPRKDPIPDTIRKLSGKKIAIRGFMIPVKVDGDEVTEFILVRNQYACCFGQVPLMNEWLHIKMVAGKHSGYLVDIPITVLGTFDAKEMIEKGVVMSLYRMQANEVIEPPTFK